MEKGASNGHGQRRITRKKHSSGGFTKASKRFYGLPHESTINTATEKFYGLTGG